MVYPGAHIDLREIEGDVRIHDPSPLASQDADIKGKAKGCFGPRRWSRGAKGREKAMPAVRPSDRRARVPTMAPMYDQPAKKSSP
jgi:hypothetical protein